MSNAEPITIYEYASVCAMPGCNTPASRNTFVDDRNHSLVDGRWPVTVCVFCAESIEARQENFIGFGVSCGARNEAAADVIDLRCSLRPHARGTPHFDRGYHWATEDEWKKVDPTKYAGK